MRLWPIAVASTGDCQFLSQFSPHCLYRLNEVDVERECHANILRSKSCLIAVVSQVFPEQQSISALELLANSHFCPLCSVNKCTHFVIFCLNPLLVAGRDFMAKSSRSKVDEAVQCNVSLYFCLLSFIRINSSCSATGIFFSSLEKPVISLGLCH